MASDESNPEDNLLKSQRRDRILALLKSSGQVHATALGEAFGVSGYTIRRDLDELADQGLLRRVHGGAVLTSQVPISYEERQGQGLTEKGQSARAALSLLAPDQIVLVDGGSTAALFAESIPMRYPATFVTHAPAIAAALSERWPGDIILLGGRIDPQSRVAVGAATVEAYGRLTADLCVLGIWGVNTSHGITSPYYEEALVRSAMVEAANTVVGLAVSEKLGTAGPFTVAPITALTHLSVEDAATEEVTQPYTDAGVQVLKAAATDLAPVMQVSTGSSLMSGVRRRAK